MVIVEPFRSIALDQLDCLGNVEFPREREESVAMVFDAADLKGFETVLTSDAAHVRPEVVAEFRVDGASAFLRREHGVMEVAGVGVPHDVSRPSGTWNRGHSLPRTEVLGYCRSVPSGTQGKSTFQSRKAWAIAGASLRGRRMPTQSRSGIVNA
jgi:hypothetical protein